MERIGALLLVLTLSLALWGCDEQPEGVSDPFSLDPLRRVSVQSYRYAAFDSSGTEVVRGVLVMAVDDTGRVKGRWDLKQVDTGSGMIGPQVGSGTLVGEINGREIWLNLNPENADNNVFLSGVTWGVGFGGVWQFVGFPGILSSGTFRAVSPHDSPEETRRPAETESHQ